MSHGGVRRPIVTGSGSGVPGRPLARLVIAALVIAALCVLVAAPAFAVPAKPAVPPKPGVALKAAVHLSSEGFPITPTEPRGSWTLHPVTAVVTCQPSGSAKSCPATFTLYANQLGPKKGLPTIPTVQLSQIKMDLPPKTGQTVQLKFVLSHKVLDLLYAYRDPRCYVVTTITSGGPPSQLQPEVTSTSASVQIL